jgi:hypothetical protein
VHWDTANEYGILTNIEILNLRTVAKYIAGLDGIPANKIPPGVGLLARGWDEGNGTTHGGVNAKPDLVILNELKIIDAPHLALTVRHPGSLT